MKHASLLALGLTSFVVACGSPDDTKNAAPGDTKTGEVKAPVNECNIHSGYLGDQLCIAPPTPDEGIQLHVGPSSYDDPEALAPYLLGPGQENVKCFNVALPEGGFYYLNQKNRMRPSSHHMLIGLSSTPGLEEGPTDSCDLGADGGSIPGSQVQSRDFPAELGPEDAGLGRYLPTATMARFQLHYVNTTTGDVLREGWVNIYKKPASEVTQRLQGIFLVGDIAANIPAQSRQTTTLQYTPAGLPGQTRIFEINGHMHSHTETFTVWRIRGDQRDEIYKSFDWQEPKEVTFNTVVQNSPPNEVSKTDGGLSGLLYLQPGDTLQWACDVNNDTDAALHFANEVNTAEMCLLAGGYISTTGGLMNGLCSTQGLAAGTPGGCRAQAVKPTG